MSLYCAISSQVSQTGPVFLKLWTEYAAVKNTGIHRRRPGIDKDRRKRDHTKRITIR